MADTLLNRVRNKLGETFAVRTGGEIGGTGTQIWDGKIIGEEYKSKLDTTFGGEGFTILNRMRKSDPVIRASLKAIELKVRQGKWFVEPASEEGQDKEIGEFAEKALFDDMSTPWAEIIRLILTELPLGFSVFEKVFKEEEGKITWDKWAFRHQTTIKKFFLESGKRGIVQRIEGEATGSGGADPEIPIEKLLIFTHEKEGDNWRGVSLLRSAYKSWFFKEALEKIEAIGYERQSIGVPKIVFPANVKPSDVVQIKKLLENLRANEKAYLALPHGFDVEMLDMKGNMTKEPAEAIARKNWEIAINVLAPHLVLGQKAVGSFALAKEMSAEFGTSVKSYAEEIADIISNHAIKQLVDLNFEGVKEYPKLNVTRIERVDPEKFAFALERIVGAGVVIPDEPLEIYVREAMGYSEKEELTPAEEKKREAERQKEDERLKVKEEGKVKEEKEETKRVAASEHSFWRPLTAAEKSIDLGKIEAAMDGMERKFIREVSGLVDDEKRALLKFVEQVVQQGDPGLILNYAPRYESQIADEIYRLYMEAFNKGKILAANELGLSAPGTKAIYENAARTRAIAVADKMVNDMVAEVRFAMTDLMERGVARREILASLGDITAAKIATILSRASSNMMVGGINTGRFSVFDARPEVIHSLQRSEILDKRTCNFCLSIDGRSVFMGDEMAEIEQFHFNCRGIWVAIHKEELEKPPVTDIPKYLRERVGTLSEFKQMGKPRPLKDSLAHDFLKGRI